MTDDAGFVFVDTNVLVYAYDSSAGPKRERACSMLDALWSERRGCLSVQVLQESYVSVTQKVKRPLSPQAAAEVVRDLLYWRVHAPVGEDILGAIDLQRRHKLSFGDAMILWSAHRLECGVLWSEDLSHGRSYNRVLVQDPFVS